jgi:threonine dehydrogenase-like Zn-dependent dehydrogenase
MKALRLEARLYLDTDFPAPRIKDEALIRVLAAGICNTDLEIIKGYAGFRGILGHEFVGEVVEAPGRTLVGRRVAGEINVGCGRCQLCLQGDSRHCLDRTVLGIKGRNGAFAEFLSLPIHNLRQVPESLTNEEAVLIEPTAAACEILEQVAIGPDTKVAVIGDGKLGQLIVRVLATAGCEITMLGKHEEKLKLASVAASRLMRLNPGEPGDALPNVLADLDGYRFDLVVEASGSPSGIALGLALVKPRGTVVLKSTHHDKTSLDLSGVVVNEITLVGSRCGRFDRAIALLAARAVQVGDLISARFPLEDWEDAFTLAAEPSSLKVILEPGRIAS